MQGNRNDRVVREVLARVEQTYLEPGRVDAVRMLEGALRRSRAAISRARAAAGDSPASFPATVLDSGPGLCATLGPALEREIESTVALAPRGLGRTNEAARERLRAALLNGAVRVLDPYCRVVVGAARRGVLGRFTGTMAGIGVRIGRREGRIRVLACFGGSGAAAAGIVAGDHLLEVDGESMDGRKVGAVIRKLRGEASSTVVVRVDRLPRAVVVERRPFATPTVTVRRRPDDVVIVGVTHFSKRTPRQLDARLEPVLGERMPAGLIVDLRGNGGGSMLAAAAVADRFVDRGLLLESVDRNGAPVAGLKSRVEAGARARTGFPMLVLVDGRTASSAELLSAALAWNDRAVIAGSRTFGKNFVQKLYHWEDSDLTLKLTAAYVRAAGRRLPQDGLEPDMAAPVAPERSPSGGEHAALDRAARALRERGAPTRSAWRI